MDTSALNDTAARSELVSTGTLRIGVVHAPAASAFFVTCDSAGKPRGVTVDLGEALAAALGVPAEFHVASNSGELTEATATGAIDVSFMPVDEERRRRIDFGPAYFIVESTCIVPAHSGAKSNLDLNHPGVRIAGIANTTTIRRTKAVCASATVIPVPSVAEAVRLLRAGEVEAFALSRDSLRPYLKELPGARILDDNLQTTGVCVGVPKGRSAALAYVSAFVEDAKRSGLVRKAFDRAGMGEEPVAPLAGEGT